jgi:hypothetical protein
MLKRKTQEENKRNQMHKPTIKASKKPFKNKSSLVKKRETGSLLPRPSIFIPELTEDTSKKRQKTKILDPAKTEKSDSSKKSLLSEKVIKQFVKNIFNTTKNYNNSYPKAFSETHIRNISNNNAESITNNSTSNNSRNISNNNTESITNNSTSNNSIANNSRNISNNNTESITNNSTSNNSSNTNNESNNYSTKQIRNKNQNNTLNELENKISNQKNDFITVENSKISSNNSIQDLKNYNDSHFTSLVRNMIQPESTKVYVNGKEKYVDSTKIKERIKEQAGVVPMFALGGMVTKPTLGLLGEKGPEMVTPMAASRNGAGTPSSTTIIPDIPAPANISNQNFSSSMMNKQSAQNLIQGNNTTNISNSNNIAKTQSFSEYNQTLSSSTNVSNAVRQLESKTDKIIKEIGKPKIDPIKESSAEVNNYSTQSPGPGPQAVGQETGVSEGPAKQAFNRFFANQTFSVPEWRQRMG